MIQAPAVDRVRVVFGTAGLALAVAATLLAPSSALLHGPDGSAEITIAVAALGIAFGAGLVWPRQAFFALFLVVVLEGAFRKWVVNDVTAFLFKDFLLLGIYAGTLPRLRAHDLRRPWWIVAPIAGIAVLALLHAPAAAAWSQAAIGLRSWVIYVPLLWVAPRLLASQRDRSTLVVLVVVIGIAEAVLAAIQSLSGNAWLNTLVPGSPPPLITTEAVAYLRPSGTMLQVGALSVLILLATLAAYALVASSPSRRLRLLGLAAPAALGWVVTYSGSRALLFSIAAASVALAVYALARRDLVPLLAVPAAFAIGYATLAYAPLPGGSTTANRTVEYSFLDEQGRVIRGEVPTASTPRSGLFDRATRVNRADPDAKDRDTTAARIREQLDVISEQSLLGHGTGTMTLGSEYALPGVRLRGESSYAKAAYELGWIGLALLVWALAALAAATGDAVRRTSGGDRVLPLFALGVTTLLPLWMLFSFTLDYPIVGVLYWTATGAALAHGFAAPSRSTQVHS